MKGLKSFVSWRTFIVGFILGYIVAWKMHWAAQLWSYDRGWTDVKIPFITPGFGYKD